MQTTVTFDRVFAALADATRRDIVRRAIGGEEGIAEIAVRYPMSFAAVQKHVAILERAGLVGKERVGRRKVVRTQPSGLLIAQQLLDDYEELWRGRLQRMTDILKAPRELHVSSSCAMPSLTRTTCRPTKVRPGSRCGSNRWRRGGGPECPSRAHSPTPKP